MAFSSVRIRACGVIVRNEKLLLAEFYDEAAGWHFNVPVGGVEDGETVIEAVQREVREETGLIVRVGRLLMVAEFLPDRAIPVLADNPRSLSLFFECHAPEDAEPQLPELHDLLQTGVQWVALDDLDSVPLLPRTGAQLATLLRSEPGPERFHWEVGAQLPSQVKPQNRAR